MNIRKKRTLLSVVIIFCVLAILILWQSGFLYAQELNKERKSTKNSNNSETQDKVGFMGIYVGMTRDEVLNYADSNDLIHVPKNRDVELFPVEERKILAFSVNPEIPHIYLQFYGDVLYAITVIFDQKYIDYKTLCETLEEKYGNYEDLSPNWRKWRVGNVEVKVEKPATVKYIALEEFLKVTNFKKNSKVTGRERVKVLLKGL